MSVKKVIGTRRANNFFYKTGLKDFASITGFIELCRLYKEHMRLVKRSQFNYILLLDEDYALTSDTDYPSRFVYSG